MLLLTKYTVLYKENEICCIILLSLPSRERGLKYNNALYSDDWLCVAPFAGAWIEIQSPILYRVRWTSLPSRERGLKLKNHKCVFLNEDVAPFAGAWIEISVSPSLAV